MKLRSIIPVFLCVSLSSILLLISCQREPGSTSRPPVDSTARVTPIFRVVETFPSEPDDSIIRILNRVEFNGEKTVVMAVIYSYIPADTFFSVFSYDAQNRVSTVKTTRSSNPAQLESEYKMTWTGGQLTRIVCDTSGNFAESFDLSYTPNGPNHIVSCVKTPSDDIIGVSHFSKLKHSLTVNPQFVAVGEQWISHFYATSGNGNPALPQNSHDTATYIFNYTGVDLTSYDMYGAGRDTNASSTPNVYVDTQNYVYSRTAGSTNIADSLKSIWGPELNTFQSFDLVYFYYMSWLVSGYDHKKFFVSRPFSTLYNSRRLWINGVLNDSYSNQLIDKADNTFDATGRLIQSAIYWSTSPTLVDHVIKITY